MVKFTLFERIEIKSRHSVSNVKYCQCYMPSYTSGQLGLIIATMDTGKDLVNPLRKFDHDKN